MDEVLSLASLGAHVAARRYGYLLVVRVRGPLDLRAAARIRAAMRDPVMGLPTRLLVDLRCAYALMSAQDLLRAAQARPLPDSIVAGILFGPHMSSGGYWYCREQAARGNTRMFFSCLSHALAWAPEAADFLGGPSPRRPMADPRAVEN